MITSVAYPLERGSGEIVVTTRPEIVFDDRALAIHPNDDRYRHRHGKYVIHAFDRRRIPIISYAELVDMICGSGAAKKLGSLAESEIHRVQYCRWLGNIRPWCISRQLLWAHRVPVWYADFDDDELEGLWPYSEHWVVGRNETEARANANKKFLGRRFWLEQDPDVQDTWFSCGLFPFSVMGWSEETADMGTVYPTSLLETGHDILFFWVGRMVMMGMKVTNEVRDEAVNSGSSDLQMERKSAQ